MRVLTDTNVVLSALIFPRSITAYAFKFLLMSHRLVLCDYIINEMRTVVFRKFPSYVDALDSFLGSIDYELVPTEYESVLCKIAMRDPKDEPILFTAIHETIDCLLTGDDDFLSLSIKEIEILSPGDFLRKYDPFWIKTNR